MIFPAYIYQTKRVFKIFVFLNTVALSGFFGTRLGTVGLLLG